MTGDHVVNVIGDHRIGWHWHCSTCGATSNVYGEAAAPKRASSSHVRLYRAKAAA